MESLVFVILIICFFRIEHQYQGQRVYTTIKKQNQLDR